MPAAIRIIDPSLGHCFTPRPPDSGSPDVITNNVLSIRSAPSACGDTEAGGCGTYDHYPTHCCGDPCHDGCALKGSPDVFVNCQAFQRNGDAIDCGDTANNGSGNVFVNSGHGGGTIIDNNPPYNAILDNDHYIPPDDVFVPPLLDTTSATLHQLYNDTPEDPGGIAPGTQIDDRKEFVEDDPTPPPISTPPIYSCDNVDDLPDNFDWRCCLGDELERPINCPDENEIPPDDYDEMCPVQYVSYTQWAQNFMLTPNLSVYDLTYCAVSKWQLAANRGLSQKQILQNLCYLANTTVEPFINRYGSHRISLNSGFRRKSSGSQHNIGQAIDIQFLDLHGASNTSQLYFDNAQDIRDNIEFDQFILEWFGNNPWFHLSTNRSGHRHKVLTQTSGSSYAPGLRRIQRVS